MLQRRQQAELALELAGVERRAGRAVADDVAAVLGLVLDAAAGLRLGLDRRVEVVGEGDRSLHRS